MKKSSQGFVQVDKMDIQSQIQFKSLGRNEQIVTENGQFVFFFTV